jgi:hypothetical protein
MIILELGCPTGIKQATLLALSSSLKRVFSLAKKKKNLYEKCLLAEQLWCPPNLLSDVYQRLFAQFPSGKAAEAAHLNQVPRLIMMELYLNIPSWHGVQLSNGTTLPLPYLMNNRRCGFGMTP